MDYEEKKLAIMALDYFAARAEDVQIAIRARLLQEKLTGNPDPEYLGYVIVPKKDFGPVGYFIGGTYIKEGFIVIHGKGHKYAGCNAMPGACWFQTIDSAIRGIDILVATMGDTDLFWKRLNDKSTEGVKADLT